jgi:hypothetical protein
LGRKLSDQPYFSVCILDLPINMSGMRYTHGSNAFLWYCNSLRQRTYPSDLPVRLLLPFAHRQVFPSGGLAGNGTFKTMGRAFVRPFFIADGKCRFNRWLLLWPMPISGDTGKEKGASGPVS